MKREVAVLTVSRSDYGILSPLLKQLKNSPDTNLQLIVSGMHLSPEFGLTVREIKADGYSIAAEVEMLLSADTPCSIAKSMGLGVIGFSQVFAKYRPDILFLLGDRFETLAAGVAALPFQIPIAHLHGGELTEGAFDDAARHALTKLSHLHFASTEMYRKRICQLGEESWRVFNTGALSIDNFHAVQLVKRETLAATYGEIFNSDFVLVTFHPVTLESGDVEIQIIQLLDALKEIGTSVVFTMANADTSGRLINERIAEFCNDNPKALFVRNLGMVNYMSAMKIAKMMLGNSSSGIVEAGSYKLPVINIGTRQDGRLRSKNVIDVGYSTAEILKGVQYAQSREFENQIKNLENPYGDGHAAKKIMQILEKIPLNSSLLKKKFVDHTTLTEFNKG